MIEEIKSFKLADFYKVFSDSTRIKILYALLEKEMCVNHIAEELNMTQSSISHQLKILKLNKLVRFEKHGKQKVYFLDDIHIEKILQLGLEHIEE